MLVAYLWIEYSTLTVRIVLLVGVLGFVLTLYFHRGMVYARAAFASLFFACFLFAGWGFTLKQNHNSVSTEFSFGSETPSFPIFIASAIFLAFSALMFWLHHHSDDDGRRLPSFLPDAEEWETQLQNIINEKVTNIADEIRQNQEKLETPIVDSNSNEAIKLLVERQTRLEEKLENLYKGKEQIEQPNEDLENLLVQEEADLISYESALKMMQASVPLSIMMLEELCERTENIQVKVLLTLSDLYLRVNRPEDAEKCNEKVIRLESDNIYARGRLAYFLRLKGDFEGAEKILLDVIEKKEASGDPVALDYNNYAGLLSDSRRLTESIKFSDKALKAIAAGDKSVSEDMVLANRAAALQNSGEFLAAQKLFFMTHNLIENRKPKDSYIGRVKCEIGRFYLTHGSTDLAVSFLLDSIDSYGSEIAVEYLAIDEPLKLLSEIYVYEGRSKEFEQILETQLSNFQLKKDATELVLQQGLWAFAMQFNKVGRFDLGAPLFLESISLYESAGAPDKYKYGNMLANLGIFYRFSAADLENSERYLRSALAIRERFEGALHTNTATTLKNLAGVLNEKGASDHLEAKKLYIRALKIRILRSGYYDFAVAKYVRAFAWLDVHMRNFWLARIKLSYALHIYQELNCNPFSDPNVLGVVGELKRVDEIESGEAPWPWVS